MTEINDEPRRQRLQHVIDLLQRQLLVEALVHKQAMPRHELVESLVHRQNSVELQQKLNDLHPADIAAILEALPLNQRLMVWNLVRAERDGEILLEVSDAVRESLIADMAPQELVAAAETLDTDEIADLAPDLPPDVVQEIIASMDAQNRARLQSALKYPEDAVGALMDFDLVTVRQDITLEVVMRYLRRLGDLPDHTDKLVVIDRDNTLLGVLPLKRLLLHDPEVHVAAVMSDDPVTFSPEEDAHAAAQAFERYDLVSAPVITADRRVIGRLTVDAVVDYIRAEAEQERLSQAGLQEEEDLFAPVWKSLRNRWAWLAVNLVTAFIASRVIGVFEGSIEKLTALAALMPIVAGIGGNSGNQTITLIVRALAMNQVQPASATKLLAKEVGVSLVNGVVWGGLVGVLAFWLYGSAWLGVVMTGAMVLNLVLAAVMGVMIPLLMHRLGRDPAVGSSVMITAVTDSGGFFIFLGLASVFLL